MAQNKVTCRYFNKAENYCEKNGETATGCQNCKFNAADKSQKPHKRNIEPDAIWNKKKAKEKERQLKQKMLEDLENEDGWL